MLKAIGTLFALLNSIMQRKKARAHLAALRKLCIQIETVLAEKRREEFEAHGDVIELEAEVNKLRRELGWSWPEEEPQA